MRVPRNREAVLRLRVDDEGGTLVEADSLPAVSVTDGDGRAVSGIGLVEEESTGVYRAVLPPQDSFDVLDVAWTVTVDGVERIVREQVVVTAGRLVPLWRLREDAELTGLPAPVLVRLADTIEDWFADALGFPAQEEALRTTFHSPGGRWLRIPGAPFVKQVFSIVENGDALSEQELANVEPVPPHGVQFKSSPHGSFLSGVPFQLWRPGTVEAFVTHGAPWTSPPGDLVHAAITLARYVARGSNYPERARMVQTEGALIQFAMPGPDRPTGLPDVDAVITRYRIDDTVL